MDKNKDECAKLGTGGTNCCRLSTSCLQSPPQSPQSPQSPCPATVGVAPSVCPYRSKYTSIISKKTLHCILIQFSSETYWFEEILIILFQREMLNLRPSRYSRCSIGSNSGWFGSTGHSLKARRPAPGRIHKKITECAYDIRTNSH